MLLGAAPAAPVTVTAQILDYEKGYIFFTTGDGFHVSPSVTITGGEPAARSYARVTFDENGTVTRIELSHTKLPAEGDLSAVARYAVALSSPAPNPDLVPSPNPGRCASVRAGKLVTVAITAQVPPSTGPTDTVYMTTDQSGWNAQAYRLDRIDVLHYRTILKLYSGTVMHVLMDRGSTQSIQVGENGIEIKPFLLCIADEDVQAFHVTVYRWGDEGSGPAQTIPQSLPTPFNPSPFQTPPPFPTPHP
jgi:hypothetical protein